MTLLCQSRPLGVVLDTVKQVCGIEPLILNYCIHPSAHLRDLLIFFVLLSLHIRLTVAGSE